MNPKDESPALSPLFSLESLPLSSRIYAGIGSRSTPAEPLLFIRRLACYFARHGLTLRSGAAYGADAAFEAGCDDGEGQKEIFLPWQDFNGHDSPLFSPSAQAESVAALCHPNWRACSLVARRLHARNVQQVYGLEMNAPVDFLIFWAPEVEGKVVGGTATAVNLARQMGIPTFNVRDETTFRTFSSLLPEQSTPATWHHHQS